MAISSFPPHVVAAGAVTTEFTQCLNDLILPKEEFPESVSTFSEPSGALINGAWEIHPHILQATC